MASSACSSVDFDDVKRGGQYCVAGYANGVSCQNGQHTKGISIHEFPKKMKDRKRHKAWVIFVQRHRPGCRQILYSILCSNNFEESCFTKKRAIALQLGMRMKLKSDAVPTIDKLPCEEIPDLAADNVVTNKSSDQKRKSRNIRKVD